MANSEKNTILPYKIDYIDWFGGIHREIIYAQSIGEAYEIFKKSHRFLIKFFYEIIDIDYINLNI